MGEDEKNHWNLGNQRTITLLKLMTPPKKLHVHSIIIVIYIQYKFHEFPFIGYLVMAEDGKTHGWMEKLEGLINTHPPLAGDN